MKIHVAKGKDRILGATIVGGHAGDIISEISVAIQGGMGLGRLAGVIHRYTTCTESNFHQECLSEKMEAMFGIHFFQPISSMTQRVLQETSPATQ